MNSALSSINLPTFCWYLQKKNFVKIITLYFCQEPIDSCRVLFLTLHFAKRQAFAIFVTVHMDPENLENPQVLVEMTMLQSSLSHHHRNRLVCPGFFVEQFVSCWGHP